MDEDEDALHITPSFKSRSAKGKGRVTAATQEPGNADQDDLDSGGAAVLFKKASKAKTKGLGAQSSPRKQPSTATSLSAGRSKLNLSFGNDDAAPEEYQLNGAESTSAIAATTIGIKPSRNGLIRSGLAANVEATARLSNSLSQTSISNPAAAGPSYSKDYLAELKASNMAAPPAHRASSGSSNGNGYDSLTLSKFGEASLIDGEVEYLPIHSIF